MEFATHWAIIEDFAKREAELKKPILETAVVSHILSPKWQCVNTETIEDYTWTPERVEQAIDTTGNLVLIEKSVHTDRGNILYSQEYKVPAMNEKYQYSIFRETQAWADSHEEYGTPSPWGYLSYLWHQKQRIIGLISYFETGVFMLHQS